MSNMKLKLKYFPVQDMNLVTPYRETLNKRGAQSLVFYIQNAFH